MTEFNIFIIGFTGMSGAGKTSILRHISSDIAVVDCDKIARVVAAKGSECLEEIKAAFGNEVIAEDGGLNRKKLGSIVFADSAKNDLLKRIIYPYISYEVILRIRQAQNNGEGFIILDAPTLFESKINTLCNTVVSVVAEKEVVLGRICKRDSISLEQAQNRLASQQSKDFYIKSSDFIIENNGEIGTAYAKADEIIGKIKGNNEKT